MSMDSYAVGAHVITYDNLKGLCPKEVEAIETAKYWDSIGWGSLAKGISQRDTETICEDFAYENEEELTDEQILEIGKNYENLVEQLCASFEKTTNGLVLYLDFYNVDEGGLYDTVSHKDGCVFCVSNMLQFTPAGEKFQGIVENRLWIQFG